MKIKPRDEAEEQKWRDYLPLGRDRKRLPRLDSVAEGLNDLLVRLATQAHSTFVTKRVGLIRGDYAGREGTISGVKFSNGIVFEVTVPGVTMPVSARLTHIEFLDD